MTNFKHIYGMINSVSVHKKTLIKSFVVQNFIYKYPLVEKTHRHLYTNLLKYYKLLTLQFFKFLVIKNTSYCREYNIYTLYNYFCYKTSNQQTTNIFLSVKYRLYKNIIKSFNLDNKIFYPKQGYTSNNRVYYFDNMQKVTISFNKTRLSKLFFIKLIYLLTNYSSYFNLHTLITTTLPINPNFVFYSFINLFFFKTRNV